MPVIYREPKWSLGGRNHVVLLIAHSSTRYFLECVFCLYLHIQSLQVKQIHFLKNVFLEHRFLAQQDSNLQSFKSFPSWQRSDDVYQSYTSLIKWNKLGKKGCSYKILKNLILKQLQTSKSKTLSGQKCRGLANYSA